MAWAFILSDLDGNVLGEVTNAHERQIVRELNGISSARFTIRGDHGLSPSINSEAGLLLRCYDHNKALRFHGVARMVENIVEGSNYSTTCVFADAGTILEHHIDSPFSRFNDGADSGQIAWAILGFCQLVHPTKHGILVGTVGASSSGSTVSYQETPYTHALNEITRLSESAAGFDWYVEPIERQLDVAVGSEYAGGNPVIGAWISDGVAGTTKPEAIFEWGTGRNNVQSWQRTKDWSTLLNFAVSSTGEAEPIVDEGMGPIRTRIEASDAGSIATYGEQFDAIESFGIEDVTLRQAVVDEHVAVRKNPRQIYTLTPTSSLVVVPTFGVDYYLGDLVPFRAKHQGVTLFEGLVRVYSVEITIDDNGQEVVKPTVEVQ